MQTTVGRPKDLEKRKHILEAAKKLLLKIDKQDTRINQITLETSVSQLKVDRSLD